MPLYEFECEVCKHALRADPEILGSADPRSARTAARARCGRCSRPPRSSSRDRASTSPTTPKKSSSDAGSKSGSAASDVQRDDVVDATRHRNRDVDASRATPRRRRHHRPATKTVRQDQTQLAPRRRLGRRDRGRAGIRGTAPRGPAAAARNTPPPSGTPACCRCRGARRRSGSRRSAASSAGAAGRWSAGFPRCDPFFRRLLERREDVGREDVAADDREVRRRLVARRLLDHVADAVHAGTRLPPRR